MGTHNDLPSGPVGCLVVDVGQGTITRALCYYLYAGEFRSVGMVTRESEFVNRLAPVNQRVREFSSVSVGAL